MEQTDVESTNATEISFANEPPTKLRHSVSFTLPKNIYQRFDETSQLRAEQPSCIRRRRTSVLDPTIEFCEYYTGLPNVTAPFECDLDSRTAVLRRCGQAEPLSFPDIYSQRFVNSFKSLLTILTKYR